jgi:hypothetical protein
VFVENHGLLSGIDIVPIIQLLKLESKWKWAELIRRSDCFTIAKNVNHFISVTKHIHVDHVSHSSFGLVLEKKLICKNRVIYNTYFILWYLFHR